MLEWLKTPSGAYNLTFIVAIIGWLIAGCGVFAGFHLNKVRAIEAQQKARKAEADRAAIAERLATTTAELERAKAITAELVVKATPRTLTSHQREAFIAAAAKAPKGFVTVSAIVSDPEAYAYANQFRSLLDAAGYPNHFIPIAQAIDTKPGICLCHGNIALPPYTDGLEHAMQAANIPLVRGFNRLIGWVDLVLLVGPKP